MMVLRRVLDPLKEHSSILEVKQTKMMMLQTRMSGALTMRHQMKNSKQVRVKWMFQVKTTMERRQRMMWMLLMKTATSHLHQPMMKLENPAK